MKNFAVCYRKNSGDGGNYVASVRDYKDGGVADPVMMTKEEAEGLLAELDNYVRNEEGLDEEQLWAYEKKGWGFTVEEFDGHNLEDVELEKGGYGHDTLSWVLDGEYQSCTGEFYVDKTGMLHHTAIAPNGDEVEITAKYL